MKSMIDEFGLLGYPLAHSFSQIFFTEKFKKDNINAKYTMFELPCLSQLGNILNKHHNLKGFNVTIPYKQKIIEYLDEMTVEASEIGAVNVVKIFKENQQSILKGYNTDVIGFTKSLRPILNKNKETKALVLGTGGASKAICYGLNQMGIYFTIVSRNNHNKNYITYKQITQDVLNDHQIIINCTPVGMFPNIDNCPDIPYELLDSNYLLYDLVYNPQETLFLKKGKEKGAKTKNGYEMLKLQALEALRIWIE